MKIVVTRKLNASADAIWTLLAERFADIGEWAEFVERSQLEGDLGAGAVRTCELKPSPVGSGTIKEKISHFDRGRQELSYIILSGLPGFVRFLENAWTMEALSGDRAEVRSAMTIRLAWWMAPLSPLIARQFRKTIHGFMSELERNATGDRALVEPIVAAS